MTEKTFAQLRQEAQESGIRGAAKLRKTDLQQRLNIENTDLALKVVKVS
jgi:hypothetical protein